MTMRSCSSAKSSTGSSGKREPKMCAIRIALVFLVTERFRISMSTASVSKSRSTGTATSPWYLTR